MLILSLLFCVVINSVSAASFYVNNDTSHKQITNWIDNKAVKGDKLIFNTDFYDLNETIVVNKPIYVGSYKNTKIIMKSNTSMFDINTTAVNFIGLNLINNGKTDYYEDGWPVVSSAINDITGNYVKFNMKNTNITASVGIYIYKINGNIYNSKLTTQLTSIIVSYWKGNLINTEINSQNRGIDSWKLDTHHGPDLKWVGNIINSNITSTSLAVYCGYWKGTISGSRLYSNGNGTSDRWTFKAPGLALGYSQGIIRKSIIRSNSANAVSARKTVKIINSKLIPKKGYSTVHRYLPDLIMGMSTNKGNYIYRQIINNGHEHSKSSYLVYKYGKTVKRSHVKAISSGKSVWVKTQIPKNIYTKYKTIQFKVDYYNHVKEENEKNNYDTMTFL